MNVTVHPFLTVWVSEDFPEIAPWVHWCYSQPAELLFRNRHILASAGVQQGDPLGPLLFS